MNPSKKKGFTLVELAITITTAGILSLIAAFILFMGYLSWRAGSAHAQMQRDTALAVEMMAHEIRDSETNNITSSAGSLICWPNVGVRPYKIEFRKTGSALKRYINNVDSGFVITKRLTQFSPLIQSNGVLLQLVLADTNSYIPVTITNRTFISTRNKP